MSSVEELRRKHILTLEALQTLSDENASLKAQLGSSSIARSPSSPPSPSKADTTSATDLLIAKQNECRDLEVRVEELSKLNKGLSKDLKSETDKFEEQKSLAYRMKRDIETQGKLLEELRKQLDGFEKMKEEKNGEEDKVENDSEESLRKISELEEIVKTLNSDNSDLTDKLKEVKRTSKLNEIEGRTSSKDLNDLNSKLITTESELSRIKFENNTSISNGY